MNIKHLETFYWITRLGTFSAAARKLNSTQPAISMRVRELEISLGAQLFDRSLRTVQLTPKAWELKKYAERMLALVAEIRTSMDADNLITGRVRIGVTETINLTWLSAMVTLANERYPDIILELDVDLTANLWKKYECGQLELIMVPGPVRGPNLESTLLGKVQYSWMASPSLSLSGRKLAVNGLKLLPILSLASESSLYGLMEDWFHEHGVEPQRVYLCNNLSTIASITISGLGISLLPASVYSEQIKSEKLRLVENMQPPVSLEFWAVHASGQAAQLPHLIADLAVEVSSFDRGDHVE